MLYCRDCGKENPDDAKYCANCGHLLTLQPTQGTGLRSLPEIKPENVEEIDDVPDITEVHILPKEEIKLELPKRPEIDSDGTTETTRRILSKYLKCQLPQLLILKRSPNLSLTLWKTRSKLLKKQIQKQTKKMKNHFQQQRERKNSRGWLLLLH